MPAFTKQRLVCTGGRKGLRIWETAGWPVWLEQQATGEHEGSDQAELDFTLVMGRQPLKILRRVL